MHHHVQPREGEPLRNERASEEIKKFLRALDSYPDRVAKEPSLSFQRYLSSLFKTPRKQTDEHRRH